MKRSRQPHANGRKRSRREENGDVSEGKYTQGPLDHVFGQHAAFPMGDESDPVFQYLASVRREAEIAGVFFARTTSAPEAQGESAPENSVSTQECVDAEYVASVVEELLAAKAEIAKEEMAEEIAVEFDADDAEDGEADGEDGEADGEDGEAKGGDETERGECEPISGSSQESKSPEETDPIQSEDLHLCPPEQPDHCPPEDPETTVASLDIESAEFEVPLSAAAWRAQVFSSPPPPAAAFARLEHPTVIKLVVYFTRWLSPSMPPVAAEWLWQVFVRLDCGLDHTEMALVRELGNKARRLREKAAPGRAPESVERVLAVVGGYYGQRDLLEARRSDGE